MSRPATTKGSLLRLGFHDPEASLAALSRLDAAADPLLALLARSADPDLAVASLVRLVEVVEDPAELLREIVDDEGTAMRLLCVLGASQALGDHLVRHPDQWKELTDPSLGSTRPAAYALRADLLRAVGADPDAEEPTATLPDEEAVDALRVEYRRAAAAAGGPRPRPRPRSRRHRRRAVGPGRRHPRGRAGRGPPACRPRLGAWRGSRSSRWASAAATSSTTSPTST